MGFSLLHLIIPPFSRTKNATLSFDGVREWNMSCCRVFILLSSIRHFSSHLASFPPAQGATAWMRCWVHGNCVGIDWTAEWPTRSQWEPEDQSSTTNYVSNTHSAGNALQLQASENRGTLHKHVIAHLVFFVSSDCRSWKSFVQHWLYSLTGWVQHQNRAVIFHCDVTAGDWAAISVYLSLRGTEMEMFAKEEGVIASSAHHCCAHAELSCSLVLYPWRTWEFDWI